MRKHLLAVGLFSFFYSSTALAIGGYAGFIAGEFGAVPNVSSGSSYVTTSTLSPVVTNSLPSFTPSTVHAPTNVGGYAGFIQQQQRTNVGGFAGFVQENPQVFTGNSGGNVGGFSQFFQQGLQANSFDHACRNPKPRPTNAQCLGGSFVPIKSSYGCVVDWRCEGGNFCPIAQIPPSSQCMGGTLVPQKNGRGCVTHYFCRKDTAPQTGVCDYRYHPVCGELSGRQSSYRNRCELDKANAQFVHQGECQSRRPHQPHGPRNPYNPWQPQPQNPVPHSMPVIHSFSGPNTLKPGQTGTWVVRASGGTGQLSYRVDWGEAYQATQERSGGSTTSFNHSYAQEGAYRITVSIRDERGKTVSRSVSVQVRDQVRPNPRPHYPQPHYPYQPHQPTVKPLSITSFTGPTSLRVGESGVWRVVTQSAHGSLLTYQINWGDGTVRDLSPSTNVQHVYRQAGSYLITIVVRNQHGKTATASLSLQVQAAPTPPAPQPQPPYQPPYQPWYAYPPEGASNEQGDQGGDNGNR